MICAVVLAAGRSERMGTQKLLLPLGGQPVIARVVGEMLRSPVERCLVVTRADGGAMAEALRDRPVQFVLNSDPTSDMLDSVRCGLRALPAGAKGVLIAPGDQPGLLHDLVEEMVRCFRSDESKIVVPVCNGQRGHPVLFSTQFCPEVLSAHDGKGLRGLLEAHPEAVCELPVSCAATLEDMDTPADYQRQQELFAATVTRSPVHRGVQLD